MYHALGCFFSCFQNDENILEPKQKHYYKGPFIIYGQGVAGDFEGGHFFLASRRWGGHLFLEKFFYKKPAKPIFLRVSDKNKTKKFFEKNFLGGALFFGGLENKNLRPPAHK